MDTNRIFTNLFGNWLTAADKAAAATINCVQTTVMTTFSELTLKATLASPRGGVILTGYPVQVGDLIQITGAMPNGQIKANYLIWDIEHDLVVGDVKQELRAWQGQIYVSVLNELHGGPAHLDVQTASNLDLAKVRDHEFIRYLCQEYAYDVFDLMRDDERVNEEIAFYNPTGWVDEDGNPVMSENRWKLWRTWSSWSLTGE